VQSIWQSGVLGSAGTIGAASGYLLNATVIMLAIIVPVIVLVVGLRLLFAPAMRGRAICRLRNIPARSSWWVGDPGAGRHVPGGMAVDLEPRSRSAQADRLGEVGRSRSRWCTRLEVGCSSIPIKGGRRQPAGRGRRRTAQLPHQLRPRDEQLLRAPLGSQIYAMAGWSTRLELLADKPALSRA